MYLIILAMLLAGSVWLGWRLWRSRYRRAAMGGLAVGTGLLFAVPFAYGCLFGFTFLHGSARPGLEAGLYSAAFALWFLAPIGLPLSMLAGALWQWLRGPAIPRAGQEPGQ
ncbi:hypothetical protein ACS5PK_12135 [Roseateles sp. DB2]|uniref:hypothetical protein n=1 Tax=Roseateles sp. DB2 TaxID=3453717 RepID=UPI003EE97084